MAEKGFIRRIILRLDRNAAQQLESDVQDALDAAGKSGAEALEEAMREGGTKAAWTLRRILTDSYNQTIAEARVKFRRGLIDQKEFDRLRHEAAQTFDKGLIAGMDRLRAQGDLTDRQFRSLSRSLKGVGREGPREIGRVEAALQKVRGVALSIGGVLAGLFALNKIRSFIQGSTQLAARYETLGVVLHQVGQNAGYSADELDRAAASLQKAGISMMESRSTAAQLISAQIDLAHATRLARIAQDAAVIGNINSSEAFQRLINGIASAQVQTLRNIGLNVNFTRSYQVLAAQLGKTVEQLTEVEKVQARTNAVLEQGTAIAGTYEKSLDTAGKQIGSNTRLLEDLRIKLGQVFLPAFRDAVFAYSDALKAAHTWIDRLEKSQVEAWAQRVARVVDVLVGTVRELAVRVSALTQAIMVTGMVLALNRLRIAILAVNTATAVFTNTLRGLHVMMGPKGWLILGVAALTEAFHRAGRAAREAAKEAKDAEREFQQLLQTASLAEAEQELARLSRRRREIEEEIAAKERAAQQLANQGQLGAGALRVQMEITKLREEDNRLQERGLKLIGRRIELSREEAAATKASNEATTQTNTLTAEELAKLVANLKRGHDLRILTTAEMMRALDLEREITRQLKDGTLALEDRIRLAQQLQTLQQVTPQLRDSAMADSMGVMRPWEKPMDLKPIKDANAMVDETARRWLEANELMVDAAQNAAWGITGAFSDMFTELYRGFDGVTGAAEAMARGVAGSLLGGVAEYASGKVRENVALAIEATAKGLAAASNPFTASMAPGFYAAAKSHALAAAKWGLLAGAGGAGQSAIAGGGRGGLSGGIPTGARDTTGRLLEERRAPEVHIYIDPLDPSNPAWQRSVYAANRYATDRYGEGATVHVHRYPGGQG